MRPAYCDEDGQPITSERVTLQETKMEREIAELRKSLAAAWREIRIMKLRN